MSIRFIPRIASSSGLFVPLPDSVTPHLLVTINRSVIRHAAIARWNVAFYEDKEESRAGYRSD